MSNSSEFPPQLSVHSIFVDSLSSDASCNDPDLLSIFDQSISPKRLISIARCDLRPLSITSWLFFIEIALDLIRPFRFFRHFTRALLRPSLFKLLLCKKNIRALKSYFRANYKDLLTFVRGTPISVNGDHEFLSTIICPLTISKNQFIYSHVSRYRDNFVAVVYSRMLSEPTIVIVIRFDKCLIIHDGNIDYRLLPGEETVDDQALANVLEDNTSFLSIIKDQISLYISSALSHDQPQATNIIGTCLRNNYGHCILNDSSLLGLLHLQKPWLRSSKFISSDLDFSGQTHLLEAHYDFLDPLPLRSRSTDYHVLDRKRLLLLHTNLPCINQYFLRAGSSDRVIKAKPSAIYVNFDLRSGYRQLINYHEFFSELFLCAGISYDFIIFDRFTRLDHGEKESEQTLVSDLYIELSDMARARGVQGVVNIDGLSLDSKIEVCAQYSVELAVSSLGSSLMFPIYYLNVDILTYGCPGESDVYFSDSMYWHISDVCHSQRLGRHINVLKTSSVNYADGFLIDIDYFKAFSYCFENF